MNREKTAVHESGHAVANVRLEISQTRASIIPNEKQEYRGRCEVFEGCTNQEDAEDHILSVLAGYASLIACGLPESQASEGCGSDFEEAERLIRNYELGDLDTWKSKAVKLMSSSTNQAAVERVAKELLERDEIDNDDIGICVEIADGKSNEEDYERFKMMRTSFN